MKFYAYLEMSLARVIDKTTTAAIAANIVHSAIKDLLEIVTVGRNPLPRQPPFAKLQKGMMTNNS
ncbi:MAG: hypothetical protein ACOC38_01320 [Promethearchaeia archaeon]